MSKHKVWLVGLVVAMTLMLTGAASAWEFTMNGNYTWLYEYRGQAGRNGFFGAYDVDNGSGLNVAGWYTGVNGWVGNLLGNFVSGTDGARQVMWMTNDMELRINPAVRVRGQYYIGEWGPDGEGILVASQYLNNRHPGIQRSFSPGYWNMLWLTAQLPWGEVAMGKRRSSFGMGMYYNGEESRSSESLSLTTFYGPLRIGISFYPSRRFSAAPVTNGNLVNADVDKSYGRMWDSTIPSMTYRSGNLDFGILGNIVRSHTGGDGVLATPTTRQTLAYLDREEYYGTAYLKYNNGRFFFNSEVDWDHQLNRNRQKTANGAGAANIRDTYIENWRFASEAGVLCGPSKLAFLYAWAAGADRRRGRQIDRTGLITPAGRRSSSFSNTGLFRPYSYLAVYSFGLGTHINADTENGYVEDASVYAARLDYAVASNLNVYGSFLWADRVSKSGWGWGFIRPVATNGDLVLTHAGVNNAPSIPDTNLGWEIDSGFDWKLLEGLVVNATFAYWQPGNWFKFACVDKSVPNWAIVTGGAVPALGGGNTNPASWGINPARSIDAIWGLELIVRGDF